jgi:hypothetical protein
MKKVSFVFSLVLLAFTFSVNAQELPKTQKASLRAPGNIKIDGKSAEWKGFQAFNGTTRLYYSMANDADNLYLVVVVSDLLTIRKIIAGGITLTVNSGNPTAQSQHIAITYPLFSKNNWPVINLRGLQTATRDSVMTYKLLDSSIRTANQQLALRSKEIKILGTKAVEDTLVSVYNQDGIKAVSRFGTKMIYTYELAIPLKTLGLSYKDQQQFKYNIKLNGSNFAEGNVIEDIEGGIRVRSESGKLIPMADMQFISYPTDFSGVYTLIKK